MTPACSGFARALEARPADEPVIASVQAAIFAFPYDGDAVTKIAALRADELDPERIVRNIRQVEAEFAAAVEARLIGPTTPCSRRLEDARLQLTVAARCIAAAVFGAMEVWMLGDDRSLAELARLCRTALSTLESGILQTLVLS